jgi:CTP:molybdopterin cytidylyltransferase MocA
MPVAAIVLAAGASRRLGQPKQLLQLGGETLVERAIRLAGEAGADPVFAVLGAHREAICAAARLEPAILVVNNDWEQGIATSIHAGLRALAGYAPQAGGALLLGCDQPRLTAEHLRALIEAFTAQPAPVLAASSYAEVLGIPAVFPRDKGARALLMQSVLPVIALPFAGGEADIDLPADLALLE